MRGVASSPLLPFLRVPSATQRSSGWRQGDLAFVAGTQALHAHVRSGDMAPGGRWPAYPSNRLRVGCVAHLGHHGSRAERRAVPVSTVGDSCPSHGKAYSAGRSSRQQPDRRDGASRVLGLKAHPDVHESLLDALDMRRYASDRQWGARWAKGRGRGARIGATGTEQHTSSGVNSRV